MSHIAENFRRVILYRLIFWVSRNVGEKRARREPHFSVEYVLFHSTGSFCRWILQYVPIFGYQKSFCLIRSCQDYPSKLLTLTVPRNFVGEPFCVSGNVRLGNFVEQFLSHFTERLRAESFSVCQNFGVQNFFCIRTISRFSVKGGAGVGVARLSLDYCTSQSTKTFVGETVRVSLISSIEKFYAQIG